MSTQPPPERAPFRGPAKRSITIAGHRTSIALEPEFWDALGDIARGKGQPVADLVREIDEARTRGGPAQGLSSAIRVFILNWYRVGP